MSEDRQTLVERLSARWVEASDHYAPATFFVAPVDVRWWLNAIADELDARLAELGCRPNDAVSGVSEWLRDQAQPPNPYRPAKEPHGARSMSERIQPALSDADERLAAGKVVVVGRGLYQRCSVCREVIRLNKPFVGSLHFCLTDDEIRQRTSRLLPPR